jgi:hypothetical protein
MVSPAGSPSERMMARALRLRRLRVTAFFETLLSTITVALPSVTGFNRKEQATTPADRLLPRLSTCKMSRVVRILWSRGNTAYLNFFFSAETVSLMRPLRRREDRTRRPLGVSMRCMNPWVRTRLRLLGRNVGCMGVLTIC